LNIADLRTIITDKIYFDLPSKVQILHLQQRNI